MRQKQFTLSTIFGTIGVLMVMAITASVASATEPCGDLGECKALVEINSTDGDIGFHFLMDGDDLTEGKVQNPQGKTIFKAQALRQLREQYFTETFVESAEPLCFDPLTDEDPENDEDDFVTLEEFRELWRAGRYKFVGISEGERMVGQSRLTFHLPAAPKNLAYNDATGVISWAAGDDLGACATSAELDALVLGGTLPKHPKDVRVAAWEIVFEPDVEDGDITGMMKFTIRVPGNIAVKEVTVPQEYLDALPADTPAKIEVGAIRKGDNATFTEITEICVNEVAGCVEE